jgi:hypothetical protein
MKANAGLMSEALLHLRGGKFSEAATCYREALENMETAGSHEELPAAQLLSHLTQVMIKQGAFDGAEPLCQRALAIHENLSDEASFSMAATVLTLAEIYRAQGREEECRPLEERASAIAARANTDMERKEQLAKDKREKEEAEWEEYTDDEYTDEEDEEEGAGGPSAAALVVDEEQQLQLNETEVNQDTVAEPKQLSRLQQHMASTREKLSGAVELDQQFSPDKSSRIRRTSSDKGSTNTATATGSTTRTSRFSRMGKAETQEAGETTSASRFSTMGKVETEAGELRLVARAQDSVANLVAGGGGEADDSDEFRARILQRRAERRRVHNDQQGLQSELDRRAASGLNQEIASFASQAKAQFVSGVSGGDVGQAPCSSGSAGDGDTSSCINSRSSSSAGGMTSCIGIIDSSSESEPKGVAMAAAGGAGLEAGGDWRHTHR